MSEMNGEGRCRLNSGGFFFHALCQDLPSPQDQISDGEFKVHKDKGNQLDINNRKAKLEAEWRMGQGEEGLT